MARVRTLLSLSLGFCWLVAGCARCKTVCPAPTPEELPKFQRCPSTIAARIGVEGQREEVRPGLVPEFEEPELTEEEKAALCIEPEPINWLEFYVCQPLIQRVGPDLGGPNVSGDGLRGQVVGVNGLRRGMAAGEEAKPIAGEYPRVRRAAGQSPRGKGTIAGVGDDLGGARVGEGGPRKAAAADKTCDP